MPAVSAASTAASGSGLAGALASGALGASGSAGLGGAAVSAGVGRAATVGALSVPQTWASAAPAMGPAAAAPHQPGLCPRSHGGRSRKHARRADGNDGRAWHRQRRGSRSPLLAPTDGGTALGDPRITRRNTNP
nr:hypothetical protein [Mycobacterium timonense]